MLNYTEILIGFDARETVLKVKDVFPLKNMEQFLLRLDVIKLRSSDVMIWDSIFNYLNLDIPAWLGPYQNLWANLSSLVEYMIELDIDKAKFQLVAISRVVPNQELHHWKYPIIPNEIDESWVFLGYDFSDDYLLSGLMSCAYSEDELQILKPSWSGKLNEYHLFTDIDIAYEYKLLTDVRVEEHRPFHLYGLYAIKNIF